MIAPARLTHKRVARDLLNLESDAMRLDDQVALVTGASSGIGRAIAMAYARAGAAVILNYRSNDEAIAEMGRELDELGARWMAAKADTSDEDAVGEMFKAAVTRFGGLDIVVANAGVQRDSPTLDMSLDDWNAVIATNLTGQFLVSRAALRQFAAQGEWNVSAAAGKLILMGSVHDRIPWAGHVNYAAAKGGTSMLMRSLAQEFAPRRVRVNAIAPGAVRTGINAGEMEGENLRRTLAQIPYGRIGKVEDIASAAVFLASDLSDYIVGETILVDGGMSLYAAFADAG